MSDTETPIEAGARALRALTWAPDQERMSTQMARAVFGSMDVEGLAAEINRHAPTDVPLLAGGTDCTCGDGVDAWEDIETADRHVAEAVKAWLTGGGA